MKKFVNAIILMAIISISAQAQTTLTGTPTTDVVLSDDCYFLEGCYIIQSGVTLEINPGVTILAREDAALIVEPGGRIEASGTANNPIVFTAADTPGNRTPGSWYGIKIAGEAPVNNGLINIDPCSSEQAGGAVSNDNSGWLRNVQIHFAGQEIGDDRLEAGLALLAVGNLTEMTNVQVSNSATNGINIVGGTVNAKWVYLLDNFQHDIFITDGHVGNLQGFYAERRNPDAHVLGSNGMVIQNNAAGNNSTPHTRPVISNFTIHGPLHCAGSAHADFENALLLQNNARADIWNSFFGYYPEVGVFVDDDLTAQNTASNQLNISSTSFTANSVNDYANNLGFVWSGNGCSNTMADWIENMTSMLCSDPSNQFNPIDPAYDASFCGDYCDAQFVPNFVLDENNTELDPPNYSSLSGFFTPLAFRGAIQDSLTFESPSIDVCPLGATYCQNRAGKDEVENTLYLYPNPTRSYTDVQFESQTSGKATISVMDKVTGRIWQQTEVKMYQAGKQQFRVPVRGLPENVYILQVSTATETLHGQLLIQ